MRRLTRTARRAQLRAAVNAAERRVRELHAMRDWAGVRLALGDYWQAASAWRAV